jgi:integrase
VGEPTVHEYERAVEMFIELHGDLSVAEIKKPHARKFREAVQQVPQRRVGTLRGAKLPEMSEWGQKHPGVPKVSAGTVNKQLGALQAIAGWAEQNGLIPDDVAWSNPFAKMKVREEQSERTSFETTELKLLFAAPVFTKHEYPQGARGPAAFWLPLLALFTGARQAELAGLTAGNVQSDEETATPLVYITSEASRGKRLKTVSSQRVVAVHPQLVKLGFLKFVDDMRRREGANGWLFPLVAPDKGRSGVAAWSKWFGRYLRKQGVTDTAKVFHSFRHSVTDALRRGKVDHELREALVGHSLGSKVDYGAKQMLARWGAAALKDAVATISYPGLDLSRVRPFAVRKPTRGNK